MFGGGRFVLMRLHRSRQTFNEYAMKSRENTASSRKTKRKSIIAPVLVALVIQEPESCFV